LQTYKQILPANSSCGSALSIGDILSLIEMMNQNTRTMFCRPSVMVQGDYE
jgi:hypothetical protein